jgi:hypothetical protein
MPVVDDGRGDLDGARVLPRSGVAHDGHAAAADRVIGDQRLAVVMVDVHEVVELALGEARLRGREALVPRLVRQCEHSGRECRAVAGAQRADQDGRAVAQTQRARGLTRHAAHVSLFMKLTLAENVS